MMYGWRCGRTHLGIPTSHTIFHLASTVYMSAPACVVTFGQQIHMCARLTSPDTINQQLKQYFTELYGPGVAEDNAGDAFHCERVIPEHDQGNTGIMSDITTAEIYSAIKTSAPKKSPYFRRDSS